MAAESAPAISTSGNAIGTIDFKENTTGALHTADNSPALSLTLPAGFTWGTITPEFMWGDQTVYNQIVTPNTSTQATTTPFFALYTTNANNIPRVGHLR